MAYGNLNHIFLMARNDLAVLTAEGLLDRIDEERGFEIDNGVTPAEVENFVNALDARIQQPYNQQQTLAVPVLTQLLGRTFGQAVGGIVAGGVAPAPGFMYRAGALRFANVSRAQLTLALILRIFDPKRIRQGSHPLCGPLVYTQALCRTRPDEYVRLVTGLAEHGTYQVNGNWTITPGANIFAMPYRGGLAPADYIALASLRSSTAFWGYAHRGNNQLIQGASTASDVVSWLQSSGYNNVVEKSRAVHGWFQRGLWSSARVWLGNDAVQTSLTAAENARANGSVVLLMVHPSLANGFRDNNFTNNRATGVMQAFGGHWVFLERASNISLAGATIEITTWGQRCLPLQVSMSKLASWYWGYVAAHP